MARNKNIGRSSQANDGLVLQSKTKIQTNEAGLAQTTLIFHLRNDSYRTLKPARGTPCPQFTAGDTRTTAALADLDYLGAQTSTFTKGGFGPGIGILEVVCEGAIFDNIVADNFKISSIPLLTHGDRYSDVPDLDLSGGSPIVDAVVAVRMWLHTRQIVAGGTDYEAGDVLILSGGIFTAPVKIVVDVAGTGGSIKGSDGGQIHVLDRGEYSDLPPNTCSLSGGSGSGATMDASWRVKKLILQSGGEYDSTPTASFSGGSPDLAATVGTPIMVPASTAITTPFNPITTVKDTVTIDVYRAGDFLAKVATATPPDYTGVSGQHRIRGTAAGHIPQIDGIDINVGDKILIVDGTARAGLYQLINEGSESTRWRADRVSGLDEAPEFTDTVYINVSTGHASGGSTWHCTMDGSFTLETDPITFLPTVHLPYQPLYIVVIEYQAIELNFQYVASERQRAPLFLQDEYTLNAEGYITIDPDSGDAYVLKIDSVTAFEATVTTNEDGTTSVAQGAQVTIDDDTWRAWVRYIGTAAQHVQVPAGQYWMCTETATIKIMQLSPAAAADAVS